MTQDSEEYLKRKKFFNRLLTIYGRKPALEAVSTPGVRVFRVHLADSNKPARILDEIINISKEKGAEVVYHSKQELARISKNSKQDQGIAVDLEMSGFQLSESIDSTSDKPQTFIALDNITNPQNLGMIIRSVCASPIDGLILPQKGCAKLDSLVIKASAGTLFKAKLLRCDTLATELNRLAQSHFDIVGLDVNAEQSLAEYPNTKSVVYVMGNETEGLSKEVQKACTNSVKIPMANGVESLNVAVTASLIAFKGLI